MWLKILKQTAGTPVMYATNGTGIPSADGGMAAAGHVARADIAYVAAPADTGSVAAESKCGILWTGKQLGKPRSRKVNQKY